MKVLFVTVASLKYFDTFFVNLLCPSLQAMCQFANYDVLVCTNKKNIQQQFPRFHIYRHDISDHLDALDNYGPSLHKYHFYLEKKELLEQYDYIFHIDCDMVMNDFVGNDIISERVALIHPLYLEPYGAWSQEKYNDLENRVDSNAYFDPLQYPYAFFMQNCLHGGTAAEFLRMAETIKNWIDLDMQKGVVAKTWDESYANKYHLLNKPTLVLPTLYGWLSTWITPHNPKIIHFADNKDALIRFKDKTQ